MSEIVGISMVKDEDVFIERVLTNAIDFCDKIIVVDTGSTDKTFEIVSELSVKHPKISVQKGSIPDSSKAIYKYINTDTWVLGLDGDEIFSPQGLDSLKADIVDGKYNEYQRLRGHSLNAVNIDWESNTAKGYLAPPCRPQVKFNNFKVIKSWKGMLRTERMHGAGETLLENKGTYEFHKNNFTWEQDPLKCLHACFCQRSSLDPTNKRQYIDHPCAAGSRWKHVKYNKGELTTINIKEFNHE